MLDVSLKAVIEGIQNSLDRARASKLLETLIGASNANLEGFMQLLIDLDKVLRRYTGVGVTKWLNSNAQQGHGI